MSAVMATEQRFRVSFDAESEEIRRAVHVAASLRGISHSDVLNELIKTHLAKYVEMAKQELAEDDAGSKPKKRKDNL
jgi:hypothetical protein